MILCNKSIIFF